MKRSLILLLYLAALVVLSAGSVALIMYFYESSDFFRGLFVGVEASPALGPVSPGNGLAADAEVAGRVSLYIFTMIIVLQLVVFFLALSVFRFIKKSGDALLVKLDKLENADIFLDLPLYVGLFGTVSSFIVMTFNPQISRLIAYSSTLIGIIFSVFLRTIILFPMRQRMLGVKEVNCGER